MSCDFLSSWSVEEDEGFVYRYSSRDVDYAVTCDVGKQMQALLSLGEAFYLTLGGASGSCDIQRGHPWICHEVQEFAASHWQRI